MIKRAINEHEQRPSGSLPAPDPSVPVAIAGQAAGSVTSLAATDNDAENLTTWAVAPQKKVTPQTPEQDEYNKTHGHPLPASELLQPTLDAGVGNYRARSRNSLRGDYKGGLIMGSIFM
ncbi:hypothetical protein ACFCZY_22210 [Streptomyces sp. NPDC056237]|uniref:hypothetical protein n=1 Tax=Streptomyces sp. NPDC056237 TaxID=3345758 RepID=UPI0035E2DB43